jgi:hypothetical protein
VAQIQRAMASITVALDLADEVVARLPRQAPAAPPVAAAKARRGVKALAGAAAWQPPVADTPAEMMAALDTALARVRAAKQRLQDTMERHDAQRARILGLLASTEKREAALSHERSQRTADAGQQARLAADMWASLARARALYFSCYALERTPYWTTQYLSLTVVLRGGGQLGSDAEAPGRDSAALWSSAEVQALHDAAHGTPQARSWALGNLIELYLLAPALPGLAARKSPWAELAAAQARVLVDNAAEGAFEVFSTRRQVQRYPGWYAALAATALPPAVLAVADAVLAVLPSAAPAAWNFGTG